MTVSRVTQRPSGATDGGADFTEVAGPFRRELLAHCYRMLGSPTEAEDVVQETYLRAWRAYDRFEGRASVRTWLYRIATNACLTALRTRGSRPLPSGLGAPADGPDDAIVTRGDVPWLLPLPDALVTGPDDDPATVVATRERLRLALIASLQHLPARQRAVLLLRDVLGMPAREVADALETTTAAVKSMLQRARARLDEVSPKADDIAEPTEPERRAVLDRYVAAFEGSDAAELERLLREDATLEMPPTVTWFSGLATCMPFLRANAVGSPGDWRLVRTSANGQPAVVAYLRDADGTYRAAGVSVLTVTATHIARITLFGEPGLHALFGQPEFLA